MSTDSQTRLQELIGEDYALQHVIGHGGMSTVWLATDTRTNEEVAVKVLRPEFADNTEFLSRFRNEAQASEGIDSPNVVRTFDYRELPDPSGNTFCFIAMEYVRGQTLAERLLHETSISESETLDILEQAAHGLSIIHSMGMVHRDMKPGNLLIAEDGTVKIADFGIAKAAEAVPLTRTGMVVGTAQYVSPEQAQGKQVTAATDVYSLGVVGYEMLAGRRPFAGDSSVSVAIAHINKQPRPLPPEISQPTRDLIGVSLRKDPERRYHDGKALALAIADVRKGKRPLPPEPTNANANAPTQAQQRPPTPRQQATTVMPQGMARGLPNHIGTQQRPVQGPPLPPQHLQQHRMPQPMPQGMQQGMQQRPLATANPQQRPPQRQNYNQSNNSNTSIYALLAVLVLAIGAIAVWLILSFINQPAPPSPTTTPAATTKETSSEETPDNTSQQQQIPQNPPAQSTPIIPTQNQVPSQPSFDEVPPSNANTFPFPTVFPLVPSQSPTTSEVSVPTSSAPAPPTTAQEEVNQQ
ncbi:serine/threonine-protein kinase [Corynebacterium freiburgense]|uniref:serine/threonine-protein kinase n=1 Tax=Corynebacterium freiburgense TaxID=556548 RepID=UPI00040CD19A|nr:serine/threonine-protein kinase [Corynebacterium freiburgense]WJZ01336.1 Serine/threonine-protein kinase PknA [Corynebacterium freiburgense]